MCMKTLYSYIPPSSENMAAVEIESRGTRSEIKKQYEKHEKVCLEGGIFSSSFIFFSLAYLQSARKMQKRCIKT